MIIDFKDFLIIYKIFHIKKNKFYLTFNPKKNLLFFSFKQKTK